MRYDTPVYFQRAAPGQYDPATGDYGDDTVTETERRANVTDTGTETLNLVYGKILQGSKTIRLQRKISPLGFDKIRLADKSYRVDHHRNTKCGTVFVVSEVK